LISNEAPGVWVPIPAKPEDGKTFSPPPVLGWFDLVLVFGATCANPYWISKEQAKTERNLFFMDRMFSQVYCVCNKQVLGKFNAKRLSTYPTKRSKAPKIVQIKGA
jgi:hypothetical protein